MTEPIAESREMLERRLRELLDEYARESDPATWPSVATVPEQQARYWRKRHCDMLLGQIGKLQQILKNAPRASAEQIDGDKAELVARAKRKAAELRAAAGITKDNMQ